MQVCTQVCGKTASIASGNPLRPSTQQIRTSWTPRCLSSLKDGQPELGALAGLEPDPEHVALAVEVDADRDVAGLVADGAAVPDLDDQRVEKQDRVDVLERPGLPLPHIVEDRVGDAADQVMADLDAVELGEVGLDVAHRHPTRVHRDDFLVESVETPLTLRHDLRLERPRPITRLVDPDRPMLGMDRLRGDPVASVTDPARRRLTTLIAEVIGQLGIHRPLNKPLRQPR